ncbi:MULTISPECIES: nucleotide exchange factor GrpE [Micrococcales]|uniref:nucleotide exchange factor GrpE n=1 Tax=Micrococcales TaxID=85006 RepID=UPI0004AB2617|nr:MULTISPECIES: nucleotide exchange factor GrpE [Micrococcales]
MTEPNDTTNPEGNDPLEDAFNAPDAEGAPAAEDAEGVGAEAGEQDGSAADSAADPAEAEPIADPATDAEQLANERLEDLRRLQAEFMNFKNRSQKEREQLREFVVADVVGALLPVIDDIDAARNAGDLDEGPFASIASKFEEALNKQGLERYGQVGEEFDPKVHEAVLQQPTSEVQPDHIAMVLRSGYKVKDRVLRAAQVAVAAAEG